MLSRRSKGADNTAAAAEDHLFVTFSRHTMRCLVRQAVPPGASNSPDLRVRLFSVVICVFIASGLIKVSLTCNTNDTLARHNAQRYTFLPGLFKHYLVAGALAPALFFLKLPATKPSLQIAI